MIVFSEQDKEGTFMDISELFAYKRHDQTGHQFVGFLWRRFVLIFIHLGAS